MKHRLGMAFFTVAVGAALTFTGTLCGCSCSSPQPASTDQDGAAIAATVKGTTIYEDDVTAEIQAMREANGFMDQTAWNEFLDSMGYEPATVRDQVITRRVDEALIKAEAEARSLLVDEGELDAALASEKASFGSDEAWQAFLDSYHETEEDHRDTLYMTMLTQALQRSLGENTITDEQRLDQALLYAESYEGAKRSSAILMNPDDPAAAQNLVERLRAGELTFEDAFRQYSTDAASAATDGDRGWDVLNAGKYSSGYFRALSTLDVGQISDPVETPDGLAIVKVTDIFHTPVPLTDINQMPEEFREAIDDVLLEISGADLVNQWLEEQRARTDVVQINPIPDGLPYAR